MTLAEQIKETIQKNIDENIRIIKSKYPNLFNWEDEFKKIKDILFASNRNQVKFVEFEGFITYLCEEDDLINFCNQYPKADRTFRLFTETVTKLEDEGFSVVTSKNSTSNDTFKIKLRD